MDTFQAVLAEADRQNVAMGHFNISDLVVLKAAYEAALEVNTPVLVGG
jgi:fructose-bisphosphate aldolase class II